MKILITGTCGFIGFNLAKKFLESNVKFKIIGIDNFDNYYSIKLKKKRLAILKSYKNFKFTKLDIVDKKKTEIFVKKKKFDYVIHLAAQAGVRYSLIDPKKFIDVNLIGYINLLDALVKNKPKKIFYASSSSVYGDNDKFPLKETEKLSPKNIYGVSKKLNEIISKYYSKKYDIKMVGMRFFTIYGEWGRPDMFFLKLLKAINNKQTFYLNNSGYHFRDFTYIGDIVKILEKMLYLKNQNKFEVFNICSNKPYKLSRIINYVTAKLGSLKIKNIPINKADVIKTHGNNKLIKKRLKSINFTKIESSMDNTIKWFRKNKKFI